MQIMPTTLHNRIFVSLFGLQVTIIMALVTITQATSSMMAARARILSATVTALARPRRDPCFGFFNNCSPNIAMYRKINSHKSYNPIKERPNKIVMRSASSESNADYTNDYANNRCSPESEFIQEVVAFLDRDDIPWRLFTNQETRHVLETYSQQNAMSFDDVDLWMTLLQNRTLLAVGGPSSGRNNTDSNYNSNENSLAGDGDQQPYLFILHLCPTPTLDEIHSIYQQWRQQKYEVNDAGGSISNAVTSYAWLNSHLTNALLNYDSNKSFIKNGTMTYAQKPTTTIVHLHQDVWARSPDIVQSRLRSKCGMHTNKTNKNTVPSRIYARQTDVRRIHKFEYLPFLEENHLWGGTGAKYGYGLFLKNKKIQKDSKINQQSDCNSHQFGKDEQILVAVATFSSKRKIFRASREFHSYELLRFCTKLDTNVVGGLTKLIAAFLNDVPWKTTTNQKEKRKSGSCESIDAVNSKNSDSKDVEIDIITSIDRDFGSNTWPNFERMEVMDPVPMFVGDLDGIRRHAVGAGLHPIEQTSYESSMTTSMVLRAGLPEPMSQQLHQTVSTDENSDWSWQLTASNGFHPVFDAGVERLMWVVDSKTGKGKNNLHEEKDLDGLSSLSLWEQSRPRYVTDHYSTNAGIEEMLQCIRLGRISVKRDH